MRNLSKPTIVYPHHYATCVSNKHEPLRGHLRTIYQVLASAAQSYDINCTAQHPTTALPQQSYSPVTKDDLTTLYENQMVKNPSPGRTNYDLLLVAAGGKCPFCSHNPPKTLDHYLEKTDYPEFSILPHNLVPCCRDCNSAKETARGNNPNGPYIHPYYDNVAGLTWLKCDANYTIANKPTLIFSVDAAAIPSPVLLHRIQVQFKNLKLNSLYSIQAGDELSAIEYSLRQLFTKGGSPEVYSFLVAQYNSRIHLNYYSWQAAMYKCLFQDARFCSMAW